MIRFSPSRRLFLLASLLIVCGVARADVPQYRHDHINIYPASQIAVKKSGIKIDGDLSDWKPGAFVQMYADPDLKDVFSVKLALAYDGAGLLVAAHFTDDSPMINHVDPRTEPFSGWNGDALQIRMITDPTITQPVPPSEINNNAVTHITMWYYTDEKMPVLDIRHGMNFHDPLTLFGDKVNFVYRKGVGGYTLEGRIPWSAMGAIAPKPGETRLLTIQPLWADDAGRYKHSFYDVVRAAGFQFQSPDGWGRGYFVPADETESRLAQQAREEKTFVAESVAVVPTTTIPVRYTNPKKGFVSLAICRQDGYIVRTLLTKALRSAGVQNEPWDGKDDYGVAIPPGNYIVKALVHNGITPHFVCSVMNSGNPSWGNKGGHYGWGSDHGVPDWIAADPDGNVYLLWTFNEGGNYLIKVDKNGQKQWGADGRGASVVYDGGNVYVAAADWPRNDTDPVNDLIHVYDAATGRFQRTVTIGDPWPQSLYDRSVETADATLKMRDGNYTPMDRGDDLTGMAPDGDVLYCSMFMQNKIVVLDRATLKIIRTWPIEHPVGLVYDTGEKLLYAVSGKQIVSLNPATGETHAVVSAGLDTPIGLAQDHAGNLWVSCRGKQMQVLGFDKGGKPIGTVGLPGGRPWIGKFEPEGMLMPGGIAIDAQNRLWVPEEDHTPKRQSLWDLQTGKLIRDFYGSAEYAPMMAPDPDNPEEVYMSNTRWIVDYEKGTWRPEATVSRRDYGGPTIPGSEQHPGFMGNTFSISRYQGHTFAYNGDGGIFAADSDKFKPLEYFGNDYPGWPVPPPAGQQAGWLASEWIDKNHDGFVSPDEVRYVSLKQLPFPNFENIYGFGGHFFPGASFIKGFKYYRPTGLDASGTPLYPEPDKGQPILTGTGPMSDYFANRYDIWPVLGSDWKQFYQISARSDAKQTEPGIFKFDSSGRIFWRYARVAPGFALAAPLAKPGDLYGALRIAGEVDLPSENGGLVLGIGCYRGYFGFLNQDGLYIDQIGYDNGRGPAPSFDTFFIENFSGYFFKHPKTGKVYLFCGDVDGRILELTGWNSIQRFAGTPLTVTPNQYRAVVGTTGSAVSEPGARLLTAASGLAPMNASIAGWSRNTLARVALDETHAATVGLRYDYTNLQAVFEVPDSSPWRNATTDWRYLFKGGDAVDIQLGSLVTGAAARTAQPGDVRIMIAPSADPAGYQAVAMWTIAPPGMDKSPYLYTSPTGEERFERVAQLKNVSMKVSRNAGGYTLIVAIPWKELGLTPPKAYTQMQGDVGILLSDASGVRTTLRRYLFNHDTGIVNDVPSEVRVNSANWGTISFE